jgi:hypothetical protein
MRGRESVDHLKAETRGEVVAGAEAQAGIEPDGLALRRVGDLVFLPHGHDAQVLADVGGMEMVTPERLPFAWTFGADLPSGHPWPGFHHHGRDIGLLTLFKIHFQPGPIVAGTFQLDDA